MAQSGTHLQVKKFSRFFINANRCFNAYEVIAYIFFNSTSNVYHINDAIEKKKTYIYIYFVAPNFIYFTCESCCCLCFVVLMVFQGC